MQNTHPTLALRGYIVTGSKLNRIFIYTPVGPLKPLEKRVVRVCRGEYIAAVANVGEAPAFPRKNLENQL